MGASKAREVVAEVVGSAGDDTVLEYVISVLEMEDFEFGAAGEGAYEAFGPMLVDAGCLDNDDTARKVCQKLAAKLGTNNGAQPKAAYRALDGGPIVMAEVGGEAVVHPSERQSMRHLIQTPFADDVDTSVASERDLVKLRKREEKDEKAARAALAVHQARASETTKQGAPVIMRNAGGGGAKDIHMESVCVSNGGAELIVDADLMMAYGRRYGLVGRNGAGKTTLLRAMASHQIKGIPPTCQVLHVEQEVVGDDTSVLEAVLACDAERTALLQEEAELLKRLNKDAERVGSGEGVGPALTANGKPDASTNGSAAATTDDAADTARLSQVYKRLEEIGAAAAPAKAATILAGLSFTPEMQQASTKTFSGGWRMRVALARALFVEPDLLLLDEPTNHLDLHAVLWLEEYLLKWPKTVLLVSHARDFLDAVCTDIIHLHSRKLTMYRGNYGVFVKTAAERLRNQLKQAEGRERERQHIQAFIDKFRFNAKRASLVQSRIKALERLGEVQTFETDPEYVFKFPEPDPVAPPVLGFNDVSFGYPGGPLLFRNLNFGIDMQSRFAVVGPNGIGKTTLLNLINGVLEPSSGHISRNAGIRMATFSQHHVDGLDLALSPLQYLLRCFPGTKDQEHRTHLGSFGVGGDLALQPMYTLSGGQKSRVAFAKVTWAKPHILLLDEPSNHLDLDAVEALIKGLAEFKGGVLMVSHDQHLISATVDELWAVENGTVTPFHGSFEDYKQRLRDSMK